jgi:RND family efflux transporter MFP subunit
MNNRGRVDFWTRNFVAIAGIALLASCGSKPKVEAVAEARPVRVMTLEGDSGSVNRSYPGKTEAKDTVDVSFEVAGKIVEFPVQRGTAVVAGDVIAKLDARDFENDLSAKKSEYEKALSELNRYRELYEKDAVSRQELETKERNKDVAEANMKIADKKVQDCILKAPFPGVVAMQYVENFQSVQAKELVARIQNNDAIEVVVYVPERDLAVLQRSQMKSAKAVFDAFPDKKFDLTLKEYETQADAVTQTFKVKFTLPRPENVQVLPGMSANVSLELELKAGAQASSAFLLPSSAVQADATGKSFVWVVDPVGQTVRRQEVEMGEVTGTGSIQIKSGLEPGMVLVTAGVRELSEGMKVTPKTEAEKITE